MATRHTPFLLYLQRIHAVAFPKTRRSKVALYRVRSDLEAGPRFRGRALLMQLVDILSDTL